MPLLTTADLALAHQTTARQSKTTMISFVARYVKVRRGQAGLARLWFGQAGWGQECQAMARCGSARCGAVRYAKLRLGVQRCDVAWALSTSAATIFGRGLARFGRAWLAAVCLAGAWSGEARYGLASQAGACFGRAWVSPTFHPLRRGSAGCGWASRGKVRSGEVRCGLPCCASVRNGAVRTGWVRCAMAGAGLALVGQAELRCGMGFTNVAGLGVARRASVWSGGVRYGVAR
jgi:hypothetical protein